MTETKAVDKAIDQDDKTPEQILVDIENAKRELKKADKTEPIVEQSKEPLNVPDNDEPVEVPSQDNDNPSEPPVEFTDDETKTVEQSKKIPEKFADKSKEDIVRSYLELERKLRSTRPVEVIEEGRSIQPTPPMAPPPNYAPVQMPSIEQLAKRYGVPPEDFERIAPMIADVSESMLKKYAAPLLNKINELERNQSRSSEITRLREDPAFTNPDVQKEMHRILEERPSIVQIEPAPLTYVFNEALRQMGRRLLEGTNIESAKTPIGTGNPYPKTPPPVTRGAGTSVKRNGLQSDQMTLEKYKELPLAEQEKYLKALGAMPLEY